MESEMIPITYEQRLLMLDSAPEIPVKAKAKFSWLTAVIGIAVGAMITFAIIKATGKREKDAD